MEKLISVLVIEDTPQVCKLLRFNLLADGFKVTTASEGVSGLKIARKTIPELILLDVMMPGMNGFEVLAELKRDEKMKNIPVFMLTSMDNMGDVELAFRIGADDYITKPFDPLTIGEEIKRKLKKHWERDSNKALKEDRKIS